MIKEKIELSPSAQAVVFEVHEKLQSFIEEGKTGSIFTNKMSLTPEERQSIRDFLGQGSVTIHLTDSAEPAEWMESGVPGVWYGVFYDQTRNPILETIEIGTFPQVPAAQMEDIVNGIEILAQNLKNN